MPFEQLTPGLACEALETAGPRVAPGDVTIERREGRWLARGLSRWAMMRR